jgi:hypothetical protein
LKERKTGIFSITVYGEKDGKTETSAKPKLQLRELQTANEGACCGPAGCC